MPKLKQKIEYCVPPILVNDLTSQCAAHFLAAFVTNSEEHVADVLRKGLKGDGGLVEEVEYWFDACSDDDADTWDLEGNGPWVYDGLEEKEVAAVVWKHTRGWTLKDHLNYGLTTSQRDDREAMIASVASW